MASGERLAIAAAFARSLWSFHVDEARPRPLSASFAVTNRCNLRCSYCNTPFLDPSELALEQIELLIDRLAQLGVKRLGLAGGEPLVRKDIGDIVGLAKAAGLYVTLNTNLILYERRAAELHAVDLFFTSLDGDQKVHEAARGDGSFEGVLAAIRSIVDAGRPVVAICVVTEHNVGAAAGLLDVAGTEGFRVHFQPQCTDTAIVRGELGATLTDDRLRSFWRELLQWKRDGRPVASSRPYLEALAVWQDFRQVAHVDPDRHCAAGRGFLYVDPAAGAYPCAYTKGKMEPVDMLGEGWRRALGRETPCTWCVVGPYLEFNLLYSKPLRTGVSLLGTYLAGTTPPRTSRMR